MDTTLKLIKTYNAKLVLTSVNKINRCWNKIKITITILIAAIIFLASCSSEEPFIDHYEKDLNFIMQIEDGMLHKLNVNNNKLEIINLNGIDIGKITTIKKFRGKHYLLANELKKIFVLDIEGDTIITEINSNFSPIDICFPNATDGYITNNENIITILDLTNNIISNLTIPMNATPKHIAGLGNQVHITSPQNNAVYILDTRYNEIKDSIKTPNTTPVFVEFAKNKPYSVIITANPAKMIIFDIENNIIYNETFIGSNENTAQNIEPTGLTITQNNLIITSTNNNKNSWTAWRVNTNNFRTFVGFSKKPTILPTYNQFEDIYTYIEKDTNTFILLDASNNDKLKTLTLTNEPFVICEY